MIFKSLEEIKDNIKTGFSELKTELKEKDARLMKDTGKREEAEKLYVRKSLTCARIAAELGVGERTVFRWKEEASEAGEASDWDTQRRVYNMRPERNVRDIRGER